MNEQAARIAALTVRVKYVVHKLGRVPPAAPTGLVVVSLNLGVALLDWNNNSEVLANYRVYHSTDGINWALIASPTLSTYTATGLAYTGVHYFYVTALDNFNNESAASNTAIATDMTAPAIPTGLTVIGFTGSTVTLDWANNTEVDFAYYRVYQATSLNGTYTLVGNNLTNSVYVALSLTGDTTYYFKVTATDQSGNESARSAAVSQTTLDILAPAAPTGLVVTTFDQTSITLDWANNSESDLASYRVYRSTTSASSGFTLRQSGLTSSAFVDTGLTASTTYHYRVTAIDEVPNESANSNTVSQTTATVAVTLSWTPEPNPLPNPITISPGSFFDFTPYIIGSPATITDSVTLPSGVTLGGPPWRLTASAGASGSTANNVFTLVAAASSDYATRISGPGVVWHHSFDAAAEVNQFRWTGGIGQDPNNVGGGPTWVASGGADGGGFMRLTYPVGTAPQSSYWWRPFNPLTGTGNGRGTADPGANGTLTPVNFSVSQGSSTLNSWAVNQPNPGWYGPPTASAANPSLYQGNDFYVQVRIRRAQTPGPPPNGGGFTNITGKSAWLTTTLETNATQEIVNYGQSASQDIVGTQSYHNAYTPAGGSFSPIAQQTGGTVTINNETNQWRYSGGWDTLLIHMTPGEVGGTGTNRARYEVWAQRDLTLFPAESGVYTKIWDVYYPAGYSNYNGTNGISRQGWNAVILAIYHNNTTFTTTTFNYDYDQIIFSKATIAAPIA